MRVVRATNEREWEDFLRKQPWSPFLQSWTMGEVYRAVGEEPIRLVVVDGDRDGDGDGTIAGICQAIVVPARRGRHLAVLYGPVFDDGLDEQLLVTGHWLLVEKLKGAARKHDCAFVRISPFWETNNQKQIGTPEKRVMPSEWAAVCVVPRYNPAPSAEGAGSLGMTQTAARLYRGTRFSGVPIINNLESFGFRPAPLHMLAEHIWYLDLRGKTEERILAGMRQTTRNLVRRAEREGVVIESSDDPVRDLPIFLELYEETRRRHRFVPYPQSFIQAQVERFAPMRQCALYIARFNGEPVAASIHMIYGGEASYHHGASTAKYPKVPASHLLQWRAIQDALRRGDRVYNFWGIAPCVVDPLQATGTSEKRIIGSSDSKIAAVRDGWSLSRAESRGTVATGFSEVPTSYLPERRSRAGSDRAGKLQARRHPFSGVTTFKTGFGGELLELQHCVDMPLSPRYWITFGIETVRKWKRGF